MFQPLEVGLKFKQCHEHNFKTQFYTQLRPKPFDVYEYTIHLTVPYAVVILSRRCVPRLFLAVLRTSVEPYAFGEDRVHKIDCSARVGTSTPSFSLSISVCMIPTFKHKAQATSLSVSLVLKTHSNLSFSCLLFITNPFILLSF